MVHLQISQRHGERLSHLVRDSSPGVIGNARRVLAAQRRELGLQVQILACARLLHADPPRKHAATSAPTPDSW
jgi:hypothetical protein